MGGWMKSAADAQPIPDVVAAAVVPWLAVEC